MPGYVELQTAPYRAHDLLLKALLAHTGPGGRVLDAGVSSGYFAQLLIAANRKVDGIEIDPTAAEQARKVCDSVIVANLDELDAEEVDASYDALLFGDTLEHLKDPLGILRKLHPKLKPSGVLVVSVPNVANWAMRLGLLAGRFRYTDRGLLDRTHLRFFTKRTLIETLYEAGFRVEKLTAAVPVPGVANRFLCQLAHSIGNLWPSLFAYQFVVVAKPVAP